MFRKLFFGFLGIAVSGFAFGDAPIYQAIASEMFVDSGEVVEQDVDEEIEYVEPGYEIEVVEPVAMDVPVWPIAGSDADVVVACGDSGCANEHKIVSKIGSGLTIENNINTTGTGWSGGPNIVNGIQIPAGFDYECANDAEMPLLNREMLEDDGGSVLAMSRSPHKNCKKSADSYAVFAQRAGFTKCEDSMKTNEDSDEVSVNNYVEEESPVNMQDQVRSWVVANGQTLREVLKSWCDKEGWDLVWTTSREYPIEASAVFKGRFVDVASALIRNFERATPIPYAKFYKGNRVLVVSTTEE